MNREDRVEKGGWIRRDGGRRCAYVRWVLVLIVDFVSGTLLEKFAFQDN